MQWWSVTQPGLTGRAHAYAAGNIRSLCRRLRRDQWPQETVRSDDPWQLPVALCTPCARRAGLVCC